MSSKIIINNGVSNKEDLYVRAQLYSQEDIINAGRDEDEEQVRRLADVEGENHKRVLANNLSQTLFDDSLHATWFQHGSTFVLNLLGSVRSAISSKALNISHKAEELSHNASVKAGDLAHTASVKAGGLAQTASLKAQDASASLANKAQGLAHDASVSALSNAQLLKDKSLNTAQGLALNLKEKSLDAAASASSLAQVKGAQATSLISGSVQGFSQRLKDAITSLSLYKKLGSFTSHSNLAFVIMEEEAERARRISSPDEFHAIVNARALAHLIKDLSPALYRPSSEPTNNYHTRILEEGERARRVGEAGEDKAAVDNARSVSTLINQKFSTDSQAAFFKKADKTALEGDLQQVQQKPYSAAM